MSIILGIDPGSHTTGYGVISSDGTKHQYIASGCVYPRNLAGGKQLYKIFAEVSKLLDIYAPTEAAIEKVFVHTNPNSALKLGEARGAAIVALSKGDMIIAEYATREVKKTVVGFGGAAKEQVQHMVKVLLKIKAELQEDEADALAVALCHAQHRGRRLTINN